MQLRSQSCIAGGTLTKASLFAPANMRCTFFPPLFGSKTNVVFILMKTSTATWEQAFSIFVLGLKHIVCYDDDVMHPVFLSNPLIAQTSNILNF